MAVFVILCNPKLSKTKIVSIRYLFFEKIDKKCHNANIKIAILLKKYTKTSKNTKKYKVGITSAIILSTRQH